MWIFENLKLKIISSSEFGSYFVSSCLYCIVHLRRPYMWMIQYRQNSRDTYACCCVYAQIAHTDGMLSVSPNMSQIDTDMRPSPFQIIYNNKSKRVNCTWFTIYKYIDKRIQKHIHGWKCGHSNLWMALLAQRKSQNFLI